MEPHKFFGVVGKPDTPIFPGRMPGDYPA